MVNKALFSSKRTDWSTPQWLFDALDREFKFVIDAAANKKNAKCKHFFSPEENALTLAWDYEVRRRKLQGAIFCNPPYGRRDMLSWLGCGVMTAIAGVTVVYLLPARIDRPWFHQYVMEFAAEVRILEGRLRFEGAKHDAPFPSIVVPFLPGCYNAGAPVFSSIKCGPGHRTP